jgi:UDP-N-acetylglucosamine pyrophosphorylase
MENKAKEILKQYKQEHIIETINKSNMIIKDKLINQVLNMDFEELKELYEKTFEEIYVDLEEIQPIAGVNPDRLIKEELENYEKIGSDIIKNNKFAVATMAGGQGTRLRTSKCKGHF